MNLSDSDKEKIKLQEIYRNKLSSKVNRPKTVFELLNTPFILWFLSTIIVGLITYSHTEITRINKENEQIKEQTIRISSSLNSRIRHFKELTENRIEFMELLYLYNEFIGPTEQFTPSDNTQMKEKPQNAIIKERIPELLWNLSYIHKNEEWIPEAIATSERIRKILSTSMSNLIDVQLYSAFNSNINPIILRAKESLNLTVSLNRLYNLINENIPSFLSQSIIDESQNILTEEESLRVDLIKDEITILENAIDIRVLDNIQTRVDKRESEKSIFFEHYLAGYIKTEGESFFDDEEPYEISRNELIIRLRINNKSQNYISKFRFFVKFEISGNEFTSQKEDSLPKYRPRTIWNSRISIPLENLTPKILKALKDKNKLIIKEIKFIPYGYHINIEDFA